MQNSLSNDISFKKLPLTQYLGSKQKLINLIVNNSPDCESIFDAFSGSGVVAYHFKKKGKKIICNDFLTSSFYYAKAFIENNDEILTENDIDILLSNNPNKENFISEFFSNIFYTLEECEFIDNTYANIQRIKGEYKKALAMASLVRTCIQKMPGGKFRKNLLKTYRNVNYKHYRPKFIKDIKDTFKNFLIGYNNSVFDNNKNNIAYNANIFNIIDKVKTEMVYFDPPYGGSGFNYEKDYYFVEILTKYYGRFEFIDKETKNLTLFRDSRFNKRTELHNSFAKLFEMADHIPIWVISYNNRSIPEYTEFTNLIKKFRKKIKTLEKHYSYKIGNNLGLKEYLFICSR